MKLKDFKKKYFDLVNDSLDSNNQLDFFDDAKNILNVSQVRDVFRLGTSIFGALQPFIEKPTYWNAAKSLAGLGKILIDDFEITADSYFQTGEWVEPYSKQFVYIIEKSLQNYPYDTIKTAEENVTIRITKLHGAKIGWTHCSKFGWVDQVYVETSKLAEAKEAIRRLIWEQYKNKPVVLKKTKVIINQYVENVVTFEVDDTFMCMQSEKSVDYSGYLRKCIDANVHRGVMLYGPPGTGKSTMARTILENLGLTSLRIRVEDLSDIESEVVFEAVSMLQPDSVILDDLDRVQSQSMLLEMLEYFQRHVKIVIATVNNKENFDEAILRPGRFDELILVDKLDGNVIKKTLGEYVDDYELVKDWPIAFVQEYCKRRRFMNASDAAASMIELSNRVKSLGSRDTQFVESWDAIRTMFKESKRKTVRNS